MKCSGINYITIPQCNLLNRILTGVNSHQFVKDVQLAERQADPMYATTTAKESSKPQLDYYVQVKSLKAMASKKDKSQINASLMQLFIYALSQYWQQRTNPFKFSIDDFLVLSHTRKTKTKTQQLRRGLTALSKMLITYTPTTYKYGEQYRLNRKLKGKAQEIIFKSENGFHLIDKCRMSKGSLMVYLDPTFQTYIDNLASTMYLPTKLLQHKGQNLHEFYIELICLLDYSLNKGQRSRIGINNLVNRIPTFKNNLDQEKRKYRQRIVEPLNQAAGKLIELNPTFENKNGSSLDTVNCKFDAYKAGYLRYTVPDEYKQLVCSKKK